MTISVNQDGATQSFGTKLTTTAATAVFTATAKTAPLCVAVSIENRTGSAATAMVEWYDASAGVSFALVSGKSITAGSPLVIKDVPVAMADGDEIRVTAGTVNALDVIVTAMVRSGRMG